MIAVIWSQLRRRRGRALALAAGILVAATSFTLFTSALTTNQARTTGLVRHNSRTVYDILVRPPGAATPVERESGLVEANSLSGIFGGITLGQYTRIRNTTGVEVAAPIANIGYLMADTLIPVDVSAFLDSKAPAQLLRLRPTLTAGTEEYRAADQYVYLTRDPITTATTWSDSTYPTLQRERTAHGTYSVCWYYNRDKTGIANFPVGGPRTPTPVPENLRHYSPFDPDLHSRLTCQSGRGRATAEIPVSFPVLLAAVDPAAEDRLAGLGASLTSGRMLTGADHAVWGPDPTDDRAHHPADPGADPGTPGYQVPVVLSSHPLTAGTLDATVERLDSGDPAALPARLGSPAAHDFVNTLRGTPVGRVSADLAEGFRAIDSADAIDVSDSWTIGPVDYDSTSGGLVPRLKPRQRPYVWTADSAGQPVPYVPEENTGQQFRTVTAHPATTCRGSRVCRGEDEGRGPAPVLHLVGRYDPDLLRDAAVPVAVGTDDASRAALHGGPLRPDRNLGGYLGQPPTLLTTLDAATVFAHSRREPTAQDRAPISAIRIRVAGVTGVDASSRARVNAVAGQIRTAFPDLDVDVTVGSSPAPQTVLLPADVRIIEAWTEKGVALKVLRAVDTKSAVLFALVLVVCALFLAQSSLASVRSRRTEIGTLRCLGWSAAEILRLILGELTAIGLVAGTLGTLLAYGLGELLALPASAAKAALVLPVALLLALSAGLLPAWRATRLGPLDAVTPPGTATSPATPGRTLLGRVTGRRPGFRVRRARRRPAPLRTVAGLALRNLLGVRGRTALGAAGLALAVAAFTVLLAVTLAFRGEVAGSLLGNAVIARARVPDYLSVALSLLLGAAGAVDVLLLSQRERAADLAVLHATGWTRRELTRLALYEGAGLALLGGLAGAAAGLAAVLSLGRGLLDGRLPAVAGAALLATAAAVVLVCGALALPLRPLSRAAPAHLLAAE